MPKSSLPPRRSYPVRIPKPKSAPEFDWVQRIDALTATGRANWLALLAYLTFALITTLGVEDIDFFVDSRQTQLPLVNVSIPTFSFFVFAPILGAALYAYLHLHIRKVTEALAKAPAGPPPLEERIKPWLLNDFVLRQRKDRTDAIRSRLMDRLAGLVTQYLIWWAGPIVFALMWWRTWPAHEWWLSLLGAACLMVSIYAGAISWTKMRQDLGKWGGRMTAIMTGLVLLMTLPVTWLTLANSEGIAEIRIEKPAWVARIEKAEEVTRPQRVRVWIWEQLTGLGELDSPDLADARLSVLPPGEADLDTARHQYRTAFCKRRGIGEELCDRAPSARYAPPPHLADRRQSEWCDPRGYPKTSDNERTCSAFFEELDDDFLAEWKTYRTALLASIAKPSLRGKDLRHADLSLAELSGVDFRGAQMEGADLSWAEMQGANLWGAEMQGADLTGAEMQGANLSYAEMEGADLTGAEMQGADLWGAEMQGANLWGAKMQGANFIYAEMEGADLRRAEMQGANLSYAEMEGADLRRAEMQGPNLWGAKLKSVNWAAVTNDGAAAQFTDFRAGIDLTQDVLLLMVGNARTLLPDAADPGTGALPYIPSCWAAEPEGWPLLVRNLTLFGTTEEQIRDNFLCSAPDEVPCKTGTPWPADRDPPWEEAESNNQDWLPAPMRPIDPDSDGVCRDEIEAAE